MRAMVWLALTLLVGGTGWAGADAVVVCDREAVRQAVLSATPGSRILVAPGEYAGGLWFGEVRGEPGRPIVIAAQDPDNPPVFSGGGNVMQFSNCVHLELRDLTLVRGTSNGLSIDDGGSYETPARHIVLRGLRVEDIGPEGNRDGIKLSGVADFRIEGCTIERWGSAGSGIDMVGCHRGVIEDNVFRSRSPEAGEAVQAKGGSTGIVVRRNLFDSGGARGVNIGGSTGLQFFRPPLVSGEEHYEAKDIRVEGNTFVSGTAAVAFVGQDQCVVRFNTIYRPLRWALRILQETTEEGFVPSRNGEFTDNIVVFRSTEWSSGGVNVGPNTAPETFTFARNLWYCMDRPELSHPDLPIPELDGIYGQDPLFRDPGRGDFSLLPGSPAAGPL